MLIKILKLIYIHIKFIFTKVNQAQSAGAVEYTDCISAEG